MLNEHLIRRLLAELLEIGTVEAVQANPLRYKVRFDEDRATEWIRQGIERAGKTRDWNPLSEGEQVLVVKPLGGAPLILCSLNRDQFPQPASNLDEFYREFDDGTWIRYDHVKHKLEAVVKGDAQVTTDGSLKLHAKGDLFLRSDSKIWLDAPAIAAFEGDNP